MSDSTGYYNQKHGSFNRREIRMVAQALGLPEERIEEKLNKFQIGELIRTSELIRLIENGTFTMDFHRMYNSQSGRYNMCVFAKALQLVDAHLFSFDDIFKARLAFDVYEMNASRNEKKNLQLISQTIRLCDHRISLLKLEHLLHHLYLNDSKVLHLCEYFDLLLLCKGDENNLHSSMKKKIDLADPKPVDQQIMEELNRNYLRDERNCFFQETFPREKILRSTVWPAKVAHQRQMNEASMRKGQLQRQLSASISSLKQSRAGSACSTPSHLSTPTLHRSRPTSNTSVTSCAPVINRTGSNSSLRSNRTITPEIERKTNKTSEYLQQLQADATFVAIKYAVQREDYMTELFPNGYSKPVTPDKPVQRRRSKKTRLSAYLPRHITIK